MPADTIVTDEGTWHLGVTGTASAGVPYIEHVAEDGTFRRYFQRPEVPPLPTAPGTVIEVVAKAEYSVYTGRWFCSGSNYWQIGRMSVLETSNLLDIVASWKPLSRPVERVLAEDDDAYYDLDDLHAAKKAAVVEVLNEIERVMPGPGPRGREGWKNRLAEKFGVDPW